MKIDFLNKVEKEIFINMQHEIFTGNILDIGMDNYGIIYNLYKQYNEEAAIDYVNGKDEKIYIEKGDYDSCVMLFSLNKLDSSMQSQCYYDSLL
jgi:hypothetical protein